MAYRATVHTLTIGAVPHEKWKGNIRGWIDNIRSTCPFAGIPKYAGDSTYSIFLNPHKKSSVGNYYTFNYISMNEYTEAMNDICKKMNVDDYTLKRFDICIDSNRPYRETEKLTRLMLLMMGQRINTPNRYTSTDPLDYTPKNTCISNGENVRTKTLEIEHYNRSLIDQSQWTNAPVINRLELRAMGSQAGKRHDEKNIAENWIRRFDELNNVDLVEVCRRVNHALLDEWHEYSDLYGNDSKTAFNDFIRNHYKGIYTREQLEELFDMIGHESKDSTKNILKVNRSGNLFDLYSMTDIRSEADKITAAVREFLNR